MAIAQVPVNVSSRARRVREALLGMDDVLGVWMASIGALSVRSV